MKVINIYPVRFTSFILLAFGLFLTISSCQKDESGCTDPLADNYNSDADDDDGSCVYDMANFNAADGIHGGLLYDKFYASETNWTGPTDASIPAENITDYGDFYRCKQCHGWDMLGKNGAYVGRNAKATRPFVGNGIKQFIADATPRELFDAIKNTGGRAVDPLLTSDGLSGSGDGHPDYGTILTDDQIWDLTKFLKNEVIDTDILYDFTTTGNYPNGTISYSNIGKNGDAVAGQAFYNDNFCSSVACHDPDGTALIIEGRTLGKFLREKPYEVHHKVKFGQPGSDPPMMATSVTDEEMIDLYKLLTDTLKFPN
jgi:thiosulfate dehydrogenase